MKRHKIQFDSLQLDETSDFYDVGHFNYKGAEKISNYLSKNFQSYIKVSDKDKNDEFWNNSLKAYNQHIYEMTDN